MLAGVALEEAHEFAIGLTLLLFGALSLAFSAVHWKGIDGFPKLTSVARIAMGLFALMLLPVSVLWIISAKAEHPWSRIQERGGYKPAQAGVRGESAPQRPATPVPSPPQQARQDTKPLPYKPDSKRVRGHTEKGTAVTTEKNQETQTFTEAASGFVVIAGGTQYSVSESSTRQQPTALVKFGNSPAITAYVESGKLYVDALLHYAPDTPPLRLIHNELRDKPANWDRNLDSSAIEIVDEKLVPRFQLIYQDARTVVLHGVFQFPDGAAVFGEKRANYFVGSRENAVDINRIFRYPSRLYKGQELADTAPPPTPAVGSISQGPGSIAQVGGTGNQATIYNLAPPDRHMTEGLRLALSAVADSIPADSAKWLKIVSENTHESFGYAAEIKKVLGDKLSGPAINLAPSSPVPYGVYVLTGGDKTPTFGIANQLAEAFRRNGVAVHFEKARDLDSTSKQIVILVGLAPKQQ